MVNTKIDMTGWKMWEHGVERSRWIVLEQVEDYIVPSDGRHEAQWLCECSCEKHTKRIVRQTNLRSGGSLSCGCLNNENAREMGFKNHKQNKIIECGDYCIGITYNTNAEFYFDTEDKELIEKYCWGEYVTQDNYHYLAAKDPNTHKMIRMHQLLGFSNYDHKDRNALNNRKCNLRPCTVSQNCMNRSKRKDNTSGVIGILWKKDVNKWQARINENKKRKSLGYFSNKNDAIKARLEAEKRIYGEFAPQLYLFEQYGIT